MAAQTSTGWRFARGPTHHVQFSRRMCDDPEGKGSGQMRQRAFAPCHRRAGMRPPRLGRSGDKVDPRKEALQSALVDPPGQG
jgi:hypothetical protein